MMQFGKAIPLILQAIWEAYPAKGPVQVLILDVTNYYHSSPLWPSQVGAFAYVVPSDPDDDCIIICIDMFLSIG